MNAASSSESLIVSWIRAQRAENTRTQYRRTITQWQDWLTGRGVALLAATRQDADEWRTWMQRHGARGKPASARTINVRLAGISSFYDHAVDEGVLPANPVRRTKRMKVDTDQGETPALDKGEAERILAAAEEAGDRTCVAVSLLLKTAIRIDELRTLDVSSIREESGILTIRVNRKGGLRDVLPLTDRLADAVRALMEGRKAGPLLCRPGADAPWTYGQLEYAVRAAGRRAGIGTRVTPHVLRATWATLAISAGVPLASVQDVMGHASADMSRRYDRRRHAIGRKLDAMATVEALLTAHGTARPGGGK